MQADDEPLASNYH